MTTTTLDTIDRLVDETDDKELLKLELKALVARVERQAELQSEEELSEEVHE